MQRIEQRIKTLQNLDFENILTTIQELDDRSTVIIMTSIIDDVLILGISNCFVGKHKIPDYTVAFEGHGPLVTFSAKISVAILLGVIDRDMKHDLNIIRNIRNEFAHTYSPLSFNDTKIADRCRSLKISAKFIPETEIALGTGARAEFLKCCLKICVLIWALYIGNNARRIILKKYLNEAIELTRNQITSEWERVRGRHSRFIGDIDSF